MGYEIAKEKAWQEYFECSPPLHAAVKFLGDEYTLDTEHRSVASLSCNIPAKDFALILILHYAAKKLRGLPSLTGQWQDFRELSGVEGYGEAFRQRAIGPVLKKYGTNPPGLLTVLERMPGHKAEQGDAGIIIDAFESVPILVTLWRGDDEFGPDANILFDKSITRIFCTEDIIVLGERVARAL